MSLICAEYICPDHGRFEVTVERVNGEAPDEVPCPISFCDPECHPDDPVPCHRSCGVLCERPSPWCISAPKPKILSVPCYATVRGGDTERRPGMLDTRPLAEGMPYSEWKAKQSEAQKARRHQQMIDKGLTSKKVIV